VTGFVPQHRRGGPLALGHDGQRVHAAEEIEVRHVRADDDLGLIEGQSALQQGAMADVGGPDEDLERANQSESPEQPRRGQAVQAGGRGVLRVAGRPRRQHDGHDGQAGREPARSTHRHRIDRAAVDQSPAVQRLGRKEPRDGDRGPQRRRNGARMQDVPRAGVEVDRGQRQRHVQFRERPRPEERVDHAVRGARIQQGLAAPGAPEAGGQLRRRQFVDQARHIVAGRETGAHQPAGARGRHRPHAQTGALERQQRAELRETLHPAAPERQHDVHCFLPVPALSYRTAPPRIAPNHRPCTPLRSS